MGITINMLWLGFCSFRWLIHSFRSISDQLYGTANRHLEVREAIMDHIEKNRYVSSVNFGSAPGAQQ